MRKTKIICTIGPATDNEAVLADMVREGMNVARFNFSHGDYESHTGRFNEVVRVRQALGVPLATLLDTKGPEIRLGTFASPSGAEVRPGDLYTLTAEPCEGDEKRCSISYDGLPGDVQPGGMIMVDDGIISMRVEAVRGSESGCRVVDGGVLKDHKGVNVPGVHLRMPYL
jgi:pyruvate kinase